MAIIGKLENMGGGRGVVLPAELLEHLGISDSVKIELEEGRIVLTAPPNGTPLRPGVNCQSFDEALHATIGHYAPALRRLAGAPHGPQGGPAS